MQWNRVLVFADSTHEGVARMLTAKTVCMTAPASQLDVCVARLLPERPYGYGASVFIDDYGVALEAARESAEADMSRLRHRLNGETERIVFSMLQADAAILAQLAAARGRTSDVVVLGQPSLTSNRLDQALLKGALMGSGRPCLVLPQWMEPRDLTGRALIAWKGTPAAARAVRDALPLLRRMKAVRIFEAADANDLKGEGPDSLNRLADYLNAHGVVVESPVLAAAPDVVSTIVGQAILDEAMAYGAELLVMGGYSHARLVEIVFGGATQFVLEDARCAVLMSH